MAERYAQTLPEISARVEELEKTVNQHLEAMGFEL
jgi:phosphate uptake regulator